MTEKVLEFGTIEYKNMELVAKMLEVDSVNNYTYIVADTYLDYGQNWMWTTIIRIKPDDYDVQVLSPRDWQEIVSATSIPELLETEKKIRSDKYFGDK